MWFGLTAGKARRHADYHISEIRSISDDTLALKHAIHANTKVWMQQRDKPHFALYRPMNGPE